MIPDEVIECLIAEIMNENSYLNQNSGCTKLVIEKVESQMPQENKEYYKFTNIKRNTVNDNIDQEIYFSKKNYVTKKVARYGSNLRGNNKLDDREYLSNMIFYVPNFSLTSL